MSDNFNEAYYSFVVLHFGDVGVTNRCIASIAQLDDVDRIAIILVDNETSKPLADRVKIEDFASVAAPIHLIHAEGDGGFSDANNMGYAFAREELHSEVIVVCNNDIELCSSGFLERIDFAAGKGLDVLGPCVIHADSQMRQSPLDQGDRKRNDVSRTIRLNKWALRLFPLFYPLIYLKDKHDREIQLREWRELLSSGEPIVDEPKENVVLMGACIVFMPGFVHREKRAFAPPTHFYYEEYILYHRCMLKGYKILYSPDFSVLHESGKSTEASFGSGWKKKKFEMREIEASAKIYRDYLDGRITD